MCNLDDLRTKYDLEDLQNFHVARDIREEMRTPQKRR
jgi:hypothetical protein